MALDKDLGFNGHGTMENQKTIKVLFLCLATFSKTGGIEKFNRAFIKGLVEVGEQDKIEVEIFSMYDAEPNQNYTGKASFTGFYENKIKTVTHTLNHLSKFDVLILGHINLSLVGMLAKTFFPKLKTILITHGIEVWNELNLLKKLFLKKTDKVLCVSNFTKEQIIQKHQVSAQKIIIFPNTIDPYFVYPKEFEKPEYLSKRYQVESDTKVILTVARLNNSEKYKGYDTVIETLPEVLKHVPKVKYIIGGKYAKEEYERVMHLIKATGLEQNVELIGFIKDEELVHHYLLADVFIMPSRKEGFGIVFIEAMACGLDVIAGNQDGSVDALKNGELGILVNPTSKAEIAQALINSLTKNRKENFGDNIELQQKVIQYFGFQAFKKRIQQILKSLTNG